MVRWSDVCVYGQRQPEMVFYGEVNCQHEPCRNKAYWRLDALYLCGVHSRRRGTKRKALPKDPDAQAKRARVLQEREAEVHQAAARRPAAKGEVYCAQLRMMREAPHRNGVRNVFPNFKHGGRMDGYGCPSLSPKALGPIEHGEPGLPAAANLENYHQGAKVFPNEVDEKQEPTAAFWRELCRFYSDHTPHRHKYSRKQLRAMGLTNLNVPLYSVRVAPDGSVHKFNYLQSRYFYCRHYAQLAPKLPAYRQLVRWLDEGVSLQIVGYDGYPVTRPLYEHYLDTSRPYGHELVLYTLLTEPDPSAYPWNRFRREHVDVYAAFH